MPVLAFPKLEHANHQDKREDVENRRGVLTQYHNLNTRGLIPTTPLKLPFTTPQRILVPASNPASDDMSATIGIVLGVVLGSLFVAFLGWLFCLGGSWTRRRGRRGGSNGESRSGKARSRKRTVWFYTRPRKSGRRKKRERDGSVTTHTTLDD